MNEQEFQELETLSVAETEHLLQGIDRYSIPSSTEERIRQLAFEKAGFTVPQRHRARVVWYRYAALAACFVFVLSAVLLLTKHEPLQQYQPADSQNVVASVTTAEMDGIQTPTNELITEEIGGSSLQQSATTAAAAFAGTQTTAVTTIPENAVGEMTDVTACKTDSVVVTGTVPIVTYDQTGNMTTTRGTNFSANQVLTTEKPPVTTVKQQTTTAGLSGTDGAETLPLSTTAAVTDTTQPPGAETSATEESDPDETSEVVEQETSIVETSMFTTTWTTTTTTTTTTTESMESTVITEVIVTSGISSLTYQQTSTTTYTTTV